MTLVEPVATNRLRQTQATFLPKYGEDTIRLSFTIDFTEKRSKQLKAGFFAVTHD